MRGNPGSEAVPTSEMFRRRSIGWAFVDTQRRPRQRCHRSSGGTAIFVDAPESGAGARGVGDGDGRAAATGGGGASILRRRSELDRRIRVLQRCCDAHRRRRRDSPRACEPAALVIFPS